MHRLIFILLLLILLPELLFAQEKIAIRIIQADELRQVTTDGISVKKLQGNVILRQDDVYLHCDTAFFRSDINVVDAFGNVHIEEGDSLDVYGDSLHYSGNDKRAQIFENVFLTDAEMQIRTDYLEYYVAEKIARYYTFTELQNKDTKLVSKQGSYNSETRRAEFKDSVRLNAPEYILAGDTLIYYSNTEIAYFVGPTDIKMQEARIYCESGWHDHLGSVSSFGKGTIMRQKGSILRADSLYYNQESGYGRMHYYFNWFDSTRNLILLGKWGEFFENSNAFTVTDSALMIKIADADSLFLTADTLFSYEDPVDSVTILKAFYSVKMYRAEMQGLCDSLYFSYKDSVFRMYNDPVLWNGDSQLSGDTITLHLSGDEVEELRLLNHAMIIQETAPGIYDQVQGLNMYGYFRADSLRKLDVIGSGESIYFGKDDQNAFLGVNEITSQDITMWFANNELDRIVFLKAPDAVFTPIQDVDPDALRLTYFNWRGDERPGSVDDFWREMPLQQKSEPDPTPTKPPNELPEITIKKKGN